MTPQEFGALLRRHREQRDPPHSQEDMAARLQVDQSTYQRAEAGAFKRFQPWMITAAEIVGLSVNWDSVGLGKIKRTMPASALPGSTQLTATAQFLPLFGGSALIDGNVSFSETPIDRIPMPPFLSNVAGSYAILITDDSMRPEFRIEDIALVNPHLPPVPDKPCLFRSAPSGGSGCVRVLIRETGTHWVVGRHNPVGQDKLPKATWPHCHRIVGRYNR